MASNVGRILNVMKTTAKDVSESSGELVTLIVKSLSPLEFMLGDKLIITEDFYYLDRNFTTINLQVGDKLKAIALNNNQIYYVLNNSTGGSGVGIADITETISTEDGGTNIITITLTDGTEYEFQVLNGTKGSQGNPGQDGQPGQDGDDGISITSTVAHYLATSASSGVTTETAGWTTTIQTMTSTNKYLWSYLTITYSNNTSTNTLPIIIGVYGDKGDTGDPGYTTLTSPVRIWDLDDGPYILPSGCIVYYAGATATTRRSISTSSYMFVTSNSKQYFIIAGNGAVNYIYYGYTKENEGNLNACSGTILNRALNLYSNEGEYLSWIPYYSTNETIIGEYDSERYRKVIEAPSINLINGYVGVEHNIADIDMVLFADWKYKNGKYMTTYNSNNTTYIDRITENLIVLASNASSTKTDNVFVLEYTKKTSGQNKLNTKSWTNAYINDTGGIVSDNANALFDEVEVTSSKSYTISLSKTITGFRYVQYDTNHTFLSRSALFTGTTTLTTASNAKYIRIYMNINSQPITNQLQIDDCEIRLV